MARCPFGFHRGRAVGHHGRVTLQSDAASRAANAATSIVDAQLLDQARAAVADAAAVIEAGITTAKASGTADQDQQLVYSLAHASSAQAMAAAALDYAGLGADEALLAHIFIGRHVSDLAATLWARSEDWGVAATALDGARPYASVVTAPEFVAAAAVVPGTTNLPDDMAMVASTFRQFATEQIAPHAEAIHRHDLDIPVDIIEAVAQLGCFGLSIPEEFGGSASGSEDDYMAMVIATALAALDRSW